MIVRAAAADALALVPRGDGEIPVEVTSGSSRSASGAARVRVVRRAVEARRRPRTAHIGRR